MPEFSYRRSIPVEEGYDLVVAGGGPAGCAAAICAGRLGAKVLLVEGQGCLGGTGTSGLVTEFDPMANGEQMVVGGLMREIIETLYARGYVPELLSPKRWRQEAMKWTPFDAEGLKLLLDELAAEAGVEVRFFTRAIDVDMSADGARVNGVVLSNIEGLRYVRAKAFVDATGDVMLAKLAGFPCYEAGKDTEHIMPPTLCALFSGIDWRALQPGDIGLPHHQEKIEQAIADGFFSQNDRHVPGMMMNTGDVGSMNSAHVFGVDALNCRSLSDGMARGRKLVQEYGAFYKKYFGLENLHLVATAAMLGIRESRRIQGEYVLDYADYCARRKFPDQICIFAKAVDIHVYDCTEEEYQRYYEEFNRLDRYGPGEYYGVPYGVLVPEGAQNLWVAGRCVSTDVKVQGSLRVQPAASMMGQAAGVAAVQAIRKGCTCTQVDTAELVETLRSQGANLPQETLSHTMTRGK